MKTIKTNNKFTGFEAFNNSKNEVVRNALHLQYNNLFFMILSDGVHFL